MKSFIAVVIVFAALNLGGCASGELSAGGDKPENAVAESAPVQTYPAPSPVAAEPLKQEPTHEQKDEAVEAYIKNQPQKLTDLCVGGNSLACDGKKALVAYQVGSESGEKLCESDGNFFSCKTKELREAVGSSDSAKNVFNLCSSEKNPIACQAIQIEETLCNQTDGVACNWVAAFEKMKATTESEGNLKYRNYIALSCQYGTKESCSEQQKLEDEDRRQAVVDRVNQKAKCGMTQFDVISALGVPDAMMSCDDNLYTSIRYGTRWIFLKGDGVFALINHSQFSGPCWDNFQYNNVTYRNPCKGN